MTNNAAPIVPKEYLLNASGRVVDIALQNPVQSGSGFTLIGFLANARPWTIHQLSVYSDGGENGTSLVLFVGVMRAGTILADVLSGPSGPHNNLDVFLERDAGEFPAEVIEFISLAEFTAEQRYIDSYVGDVLVVCVRATGAWSAPGLRIGAIGLEGVPQ